MPAFLSYTIFEDLALTTVRDIANLEGPKAERFLRIFHDLKGNEPREGDIINGCRIDRIGSEDYSEAAL